MKTPQKNDTPCIAFTGGGTGGHIYPGAAVADELRGLLKEKPLRICWIGSSSGMDRDIVEKTGCADIFYGIPSGKLRRYFSLKTFADMFRVLGGFFSALRILKKERPALLFSKGGFVSVPPCFAAALLGIPVYTHECDFSPGLATRLNAKYARRILISYEETACFFSSGLRSRVIVTGNPVRPAFYSASRDEGFRFLGLGSVSKASLPILLVLGGSSGSVQINGLVFQNLDWLCSRFVVVHQTGRSHAAVIPEHAPGHIARNYKPYRFIYGEMPHVMAAADIVLSRAGANSLAELLVLCRPMILIPLCGSGTRGDQMENAAFLEEKGAAEVLSGKNADDAHLKEALEKMYNAECRGKYGERCRLLAGTERAAKKIAGLLVSEVSAR